MGLSAKVKLLVDRGSLKVYKGGPFLEINVDGILVGKVMKLSEIICPPTIAAHDDCSGYGIRLKHMTILLSTEEHVNILWELNQDDQRRAERAERNDEPSVFDNP